MIQHSNEHEHEPLGHSTPQEHSHGDLDGGHEHIEDGQHHEHERHGDHEHSHDDEVEVKVNGRPVILHGKHATGAQIKAAAIAQGVAIQQNFVLQEDLPNGTSTIIGDADEVHLRPHLKFTAIRPDDNS